jgi:polysaccharide export outer membrane protein
VDPTYERIVAEQSPTVQSDVLGASDRFELRVVGEDELSGEFTVSSNGTINYQWVGELAVAGKTCDEVASLVRATLADGYIRDPSVSCQIVELNSRKVDVIGEVNQPGSFVFESEMTVLRAVALAQGFTPDAAPDETSVLRMIDGQETRIRVPVEEIIAGRQPNFLLEPGDTIVVPRYSLIP